LEFDVRKFLIGLLLGVPFLVFSSPGNTNSGGGDADSQYVPLEPVLVNLAGKRRYLRADIQLLVDSSEHADKMKGHMPALRHGLIMLFSGRDADKIFALDQREMLRQNAKEEVKKILDHYGAGKGLKDLFFTDFIVQ
jgi:flagellar FliL protein